MSPHKPTGMERQLAKHGDPKLDENQEEAAILDELLELRGLKPEKYPTMDDKRAALDVADIEGARAMLKREKEGGDAPVPPTSESGEEIRERAETERETALAPNTGTDTEDDGEESSGTSRTSRKNK